MTKRILQLISIAALSVATTLVTPAEAQAGTRLKDLVDVQGVRENPLVGYGLVVGLQGTGDDARSPITRRALANLVTHLGVQISEDQMRAKNVAAVLVTARLPPFSRPGAPIDVTVSSVSTAKSLVGGTLVATPLLGADSKTYALAQGSLSLGAFSAGGRSGSQARKNHTTVAVIPSGGIIERKAPGRISDERIVFVMKDADFTTAERIATAIDEEMGGDIAYVRDPGSVRIEVPRRWQSRVPTLIARLESLEVIPDVRARVIIDERTGTIVVGSNVTLGEAAIAHGGISVRINEQPAVSQPGPGILNSGSTVVVPQTQVEVVEEPGKLHVMAEAPSVGAVTSALNALGVKPRDLVAILRALAASGALRAELEIL
jgi:flagellar P-ring protein precursor FlgI